MRVLFYGGCVNSFVSYQLFDGYVRVLCVGDVSEAVRLLELRNYCGYMYNLASIIQLPSIFTAKRSV